MDLLPTELLERIFSHLSYSEKVDLLPVCRRWKTVLDQDVWRPASLVVSGEGLPRQAQFLLGQYGLLPGRFRGIRNQPERGAYRQEDTVNGQQYYLYWKKRRWEFSHVLGASDGRYPGCISDSCLPPTNGWLKHCVLEVSVPASLPLACCVTVAVSDEVERLRPGCQGNYYLMEGVWSCGRPVYRQRGHQGKVLLVTGWRWGVQREVESWGEVLVRATEGSLDAGGVTEWVACGA